MAKTRYITRTIITTNVRAYYFDESTDQVASYSTSIPGEHSPETALAYLRYQAKHSEGTDFKNTNFVKVSIISVEEDKYRMTEDDFTLYGEKVSHPSEQSE